MSGAVHRPADRSRSRNLEGCCGPPHRSGISRLVNLPWLCSSPPAGPVFCTLLAPTRHRQTPSFPSWPPHHCASPCFHCRKHPFRNPGLGSRMGALTAGIADAVQRLSRTPPSLHLGPCTCRVKSLSPSKPAGDGTEAEFRDLEVFFPQNPWVSVVLGSLDLYTTRCSPLSSVT